MFSGSHCTTSIFQPNANTMTMPLAFKLASQGSHYKSFIATQSYLHESFVNEQFIRKVSGVHNSKINSEKLRAATLLNRYTLIFQPTQFKFQDTATGCKRQHCQANLVCGTRIIEEHFILKNNGSFLFAVCISNENSRVMLLN